MAWARILLISEFLELFKTKLSIEGNKLIWAGSKKQVIDLTDVWFLNFNGSVNFEF